MCSSGPETYNDPNLAFFCIVFDNKFLRGCLLEKTGTGASFIPG